MIAINPRDPLNIVGGSVYQALGELPNGAAQYYQSGVSGAYTSFDGGHTWVDQMLPPSPDWFNNQSANCNHLHLADSALAFGPNDTVYYVDLSDSIGNHVGCQVATAALGLYVTISRDGGKTWGTPFGLAGTVAGAFMDKPWIAVDPKTGEAYVAWNDDSNGTISLRNTTDSGKSWSKPVVITSGGGLGVELAVDPWGGVEAAWAGSSAPQFSRSTDHGRSFSSPVDISSASTAWASSSPDGFRAPALPGLTVANLPGARHNGRIFVVYQNGSGGGVGTPLVSLSYSDTNGTSWSNPLTVNSNTKLEDFQPDVAVGPDGTVYVEWYGENSVNGHYRDYAAVSHNAGATFDPQFAVSDVDSLPQYTYSGGPFSGWWIGDYTHILANKNGAYPFWTDARSPIAQSCTACIFNPNYNISMYTAQLVNASLDATVPVDVSLGGSVPVVGVINTTPAPKYLDWLAGSTFNVSAPPVTSLSGTTYYFAAWWGLNYSTSPDMSGRVTGPGGLHACYETTAGATCHAAGAPGFLSISVRPAAATVTLDGSALPPLNGTQTLRLDPGAHLLRAHATGYHPATLTFTVNPGNTTVLTVRLVPFPGTLAGSVAPATATITANGTNVPVSSNGTFQANLIPGTYVVVAQARGYRTNSSSPVFIRLNQTTTLSFSLVALPGWVNGTISPSWAIATLNGAALSTPGGHFSVLERMGTYWVNASTPGYRSSTSGPVVLEPGGAVRVAVALDELTGTITGSVAPSTATVTIDGSPVTLTGGSFRVSEFPGVYSVVASAPDFASATQYASVRYSESTSVSFLLNPAYGWIHGNVAPAGASVTVDGKPLTVSGSGLFNQSATPGVHRIHATLAGYLESDQNVTVPAGHGVGIQLVLTPTAPPSKRVDYVGIAILSGGIGAALVVLGVVWVFRRRARRPGAPGESDRPGSA